MRERPQDDRGDDTRQRRIDALRGLAQGAEPVPSAPTAPASAPALPSLAPARFGGGWRRWGASASVFVVVLVVVGVVVGAILQQSGLVTPGRGAAQPALVGTAYTLTGAKPLSCFSPPAWSPDGKQLAVVAVAQAATDPCFLANTMTNVSQPDSVGNTSTSGLPPDTSPSLS